MISIELTDAFYEGRRTAVYPLAVNDVVLVKKGRKSGEFAAVISIASPAPALCYLVEYGDGTDDIISIAELELNERDQAPEAMPGSGPS
jgi:hypothetical protein